MNRETVLTVKNLTTVFDTESGPIRAVDNVSFNLQKGGTLGIVGESGCGKSVTALSVMRLLPQPLARIENGRILLGDTDITALAADDVRKIRGARISMIFQEPMTALNPVHKIGKQIGEVFRIHYPEMTRPAIVTASSELLHKVGIPDPQKRLEEYPHQISGGMRQRVMIAMALACQPDILIADEPTTAIDVTIQAQILALMQSLQRETGMAIIFITHDLGVIAEMCDEVLVMYAGRVAEMAPVTALFQNPQHPYTRGLLASMPRLENPGKTRLHVIRGMVPGLDQLPPGCRFQNRCDYAQAICQTAPPPLEETGADHLVSCYCHSKGYKIQDVTGVESSQFTTLNADHTENFKPDTTDVCLEVKHLKKHFPVHGGVLWRTVGHVSAVDGISFKIKHGQTVGLVGESGCGKTTVGRTLLRLYKPTSGDVIFDGRNLAQVSSRAMRNLRRDMQIIFQDPFESLNARHTIAEILEEPFVIHKIGSAAERRQEVLRLLDRVGMPANSLNRFPHEFSGGQRQRIGIARAIALKPRLIVCDEPVSALDVSIQSQILNLLGELQQEMGLTYLFIAHDLAVVKHISDMIAVMYLGKIVEFTDAATIYQRPRHPYTRALISAIPIPDPTYVSTKIILQGDVPSPRNPPAGCRFHTRCAYAIDCCIQEEPPLIPVSGSQSDSHLTACLREKESDF
jgi:peptide/nickel transport system ATP-binding protein